MPQRVLLKKYGNRRLYDTERSAYVTLDQVAELVKAGRQVEVINAKTQEDVTAFTLTQILLEEARKRNVLLPVPLLHLFIQYGENVLEEFFQKYLERTLKNYLTYKSAVDEQFRKWLDMGAQLSRAASETMGKTTSFEFLGRFFDSQASQEKERE